MWNSSDGNSSAKKIKYIGSNPQNEWLHTMYPPTQVNTPYELQKKKIWIQIATSRVLQENQGNHYVQLRIEM